MSFTHITRPARRASGLVVTFLAIELVDELVDGAITAAWPAIRADLSLDYAQVGLLLAIPRIVGNALEPPLAILGDAGDRRRLVLGGGVAFAIALLLSATSWSFAALLVAFTVFSPASGAFVSLSQATLMDLEPHRHAQNMARWTFAGSLGVVGGAALIATGTGTGISWRVIMVGIAAVTGALVVVVWRQRFLIPVGGVAGHEPSGLPASASCGRAEHARNLAEAGWDAESEREVPGNARDGAGRLSTLARGAAEAVRALRRRDVLRWTALLQASNLMLDVLHGFLALYLVDVAGLSAGQAALAIAAWTGVGLLGDALLIPLLERVDGVRYLRVSAGLATLAFGAFLLVPGFVPKLVVLAVLGLLNSGWYAITKAGLYSALPGRSATVLAIANVGDFAGAFIPLGIGLVASRVGLAPAMWILLAGPVALWVGLPAGSRGRIIAVPSTELDP